jgi:hypothetical protein
MSKKGNAIFFIIFLAIFIFLALYVGIYVYKLYFATQGYSSAKTQETLDCSDLGISITNYQYENKTLTLELKNNLREISAIHLIINGEETKKEFAHFSSGSIKTLTISNVETFSIYPEDCKDNVVNLNLNETQ